MLKLFEIGSIFDLVIIVFLGITLVVCAALIYCVIIQAFGYNPLEKGVICKMLKELFRK